MSRAPVKPPAKKASDAKAAGAPERTPSKRAPKRAVAVETAEAVVPRANAASARVKAISGRDKMLKAQHELHAALERAEKANRMRSWEEAHFPSDLPDKADIARERREDSVLWTTVAFVFCVLAVIAVIAVWSLK